MKQNAEAALLSAQTRYRELGGVDEEGVALLAHMFAREAGHHDVAEQLAERRRSYPLSPNAAERYLWPNHVPSDSIGALLAAPNSWLRGPHGSLTIEAILPELALTAHFPRRRIHVLVKLDGELRLLVHHLHRDDDSLDLLATTDHARFTEAAAGLATSLRATPERILETRLGYTDDTQWLVPLLDALVPEPAENSVYTWLVRQQKELFSLDCGVVRFRIADVTIGRSLADFGKVRANQVIERLEGREVVDTAELAFQDVVPGRTLLEPMRDPAAASRAIERYRARKGRETPPDPLIFGGLDPGYTRMLAEVAAYGERSPVAPEPAVTDEAVAAGARDLRIAEPDELDHESLRVDEALHAFALGPYRIYFCTNGELDQEEGGAIVLADTRNEPPIVVRAADSMDPGSVVDGSSRHFAAFMTWLERSLERAVIDDKALAWLRAPGSHSQLIHDVHAPDRGEGRPWRFSNAVPWVELDEEMLKAHVHGVAVYHAFLRDAIDQSFAPGWDPRAEVAALRGAPRE